MSHRNHSLAVAIAMALTTPAWAADGNPHLEEVVITAAPLGEARAKVVQPTVVLGGDELARRLAPTLGETLAAQPGVTTTYFGPAASRPVIRGLGGDRVQLLTDGIPALDVSGLSEDHATAIEPALADQVEILKGPTTLLYGSGAAGGAVNVVTNRIHHTLPDRVSGLVEVRGDSAHEERAGAGRVDFAVGPVALHADATWRETDDLRIPGFTQSRALREELELEGSDELVTRRGVAPNTWSETQSGGIGASLVGERGHVGVAASRYDTEYGIPLEDGAFIDLVQDRVDVEGRLEVGGLVRALNLRGSVNDYEHAEVEPDGEVGTRFTLEGREVRFALDHAELAGFAGTVGVQWQDIDFGAAGEEAFVPPSTTRTLALFSFQRRDFGGYTLEFGARAENQRSRAEAGAALPAYDDTAISLSAGTLVRLGGDWALAAQVTRTERNPTSTELFADGPHAATGQYEIGDPGFGTERGVTLDLGLRRTAGAVEFEVNAFYNDYSDFIYLNPTGTVVVDDEGGTLPVFQFVQRDAKFYGLEASARLPLAGGFALGLSADHVRASTDDGDLPRIPPLRIGGSLEWASDRLSAAVEVMHAFEQDRTAEFEARSAGYTLVGFDLAWQMPVGDQRWRLFLKGSNLLDEEARPHASPLKDSVPLPGRGFAAGVRLAF